MGEKDQPQRGLEVVKWYTRARKFPQLLGRTPDGAKLWGGPYTITQAVVGGVVVFVGSNTVGLWGQFGFIGNIVVLAAVGYGSVLVVGWIPVGSRNPIAVVTGTSKALTAPRHGRLGGRPVRLRRPRRLHHRVLIGAPGGLRPTPVAVARAASNPASAPPEVVTPQHPSTHGRRPALTGVQALLAANDFQRSEND